MSSHKTKLSACFRNELRGTDAYSRHKRLMKDYFQFYGDNKPRSVPEKYKTERDIIKENLKIDTNSSPKFVHPESEENASWEQRVAKKYYDKLFKEYAICELKYYKEGKIALRWRAEKEVMSGKGQFICASTRCESTTSLKSWEVNFGYIEENEKKNELVKVRLCPDCSDKLNYKTKKRQAKTLKRKRREKESSRKRTTIKRESDSESSPSEDESSDNESEEEEKVKAESSIWSQPLDKADEKTKEEEYEDYFADLLQ
ncbi:unnamed protein product [Mucor hiemalis]